MKTSETSYFINFSILHVYIYTCTCIHNTSVLQHTHTHSRSCVVLRHSNIFATIFTSYCILNFLQFYSVTVVRLLQYCELWLDHTRCSLVHTLHMHMYIISVMVTCHTGYIYSKLHAYVHTHQGHSKQIFSCQARK